jgi:hypothetical protein
MSHEDVMNRAAFVETADEVDNAVEKYQRQVNANHSATCHRRPSVLPDRSSSPLTRDPHHHLLDTGDPEAAEVTRVIYMP